MKNQKGFGAVEALLIVVIVGLIGFVGWYVWNAKSDSESQFKASTSNESKDSNSPSIYKKTTKVPSSWVAFSNKYYKLTISHPTEWYVSGYEFSEFVEGTHQVYGVDMAKSKNKDCECATVTVKIYNQSLESTVAFEKNKLKLPKSNTNNLTVTNLKINGNDAVKIDAHDSNVLSGTMYLIYKDSYTYEVILFKDRSDNEISKDTLTSFESLQLN